MTGRVRKLLTDNCPFGEADNCEACLWEGYIRMSARISTAAYAKGNPGRLRAINMMRGL